jgi:hypothetical protein
MLTPTMFQIQFTTSQGGTTYGYLRAPYACKIRDLLVVCQADPGDDDVVSVLSDAQTIGTCTFDAAVDVGEAAGAYAPDTTYGDTQFAAGDLIRISCTTTATAAVGLWCNLTLDPFCLSA